MQASANRKIDIFVASKEPAGRNHRADAKRRKKSRTTQASFCFWEYFQVSYAPLQGGEAAPVAMMGVKRVRDLPDF